MRFFRDDPRTSTVRWYFVDDAPFIEVPTVFNSTNYDPDHIGWDGLGEVYGAPRSWSNGAPPGPPQKLELCGTADQWLTGDSLPPDPPVATDVFGVPMCCSNADQWAACPNLKDGYGYRTYWLRCTDAFGDFAPLNGIWRLDYVSDCTWRSQLIELPGTFFHKLRWQITASPTGVGPNGGMFLGLLRVTSGFAATARPAPDWDGRTTVDVARFLSLPFLGMPVYVYDIGPEEPTSPPEDLDMLIGAIVWDSGADAVPPKYLLCDGSAVSRSVYSLLYGRLGDTYGPGDGSTTFNLPALADRFPMGASGAHPLGTPGGEAAHVLTTAEMPAHGHTLTDPGHVHPADTSTGHLFLEADGSTVAGANGADFYTYNAYTSNSQTDPAFTGQTVDNAGGGGAHNNLPPYLPLRALIYAGV